MSVVTLSPASVPAVAQQRPFLFSVTTAEAPKPAVRFDYDVGVGERAFQSDTANQPEQRVGVQASRGRLTFLARFGIAEVGSSYQSSQSGEALYSILAPANRVALAAGGGMLHEAEGGARLLAGPSIHVAPVGRRWQFTATGGPVFHPSDDGAQQRGSPLIFRPTRRARATRSKPHCRSR